MLTFVYIFATDVSCKIYSVINCYLYSMSISVVYLGDSQEEINNFRSIVATQPCLDYKAGFSTAESCYEYVVKAKNHHLVFIEADLPDEQGLWLARQLRATKNGVVLLSAHTNVLNHAFELNALDYMLKPVSEVAMEQAISRISEQHQVINAIMDEPVKDLKQAALQNLPSRIFLHMISSIEVVILADVLYISSQGNYSKFIKRDGTELLSSKNIKNYESLLIDHPDFIRIQKSYIVNRKYILSISKKMKNYKAVLINKEELEISYPRREEILKRIME